MLPVATAQTSSWPPPCPPVSLLSTADPSFADPSFACPVPSSFVVVVCCSFFFKTGMVLPSNTRYLFPIFPILFGCFRKKSARSFVPTPYPSPAAPPINPLTHRPIALTPVLSPAPLLFFSSGQPFPCFRSWFVHCVRCVWPCLSFRLHSALVENKKRLPTL